MLQSALIFAMVAALCGTTLTKAYASCSSVPAPEKPKVPIVIEHVWDDNGNENTVKDTNGNVVKNEDGMDKVESPQEELTVEVELTVGGETESVTMDGSETGEQAGLDKGETAGSQASVSGNLFQIESEEGGELLSAYMTAYQEYAASADEDDEGNMTYGEDEQTAMEEALGALKAWCKEGMVDFDVEIPAFGNDSKMTEGFNSTYREGCEKGFWEAFKDAADAKVKEINAQISTAEFMVETGANAEEAAKPPLRRSFRTCLSRWNSPMSRRRP